MRLTLEAGALFWIWVGVSLAFIVMGAALLIFAWSNLI